MAVIKTKNNSNVVPAATALKQGELAVDVAQGRLWVGEVDDTSITEIVGGAIGGGTDDQTLRWNNGAWEATSDLVVDDAGNVTASGDVTANAFLGDGSQLTNLPAGTQWDDVTGGINYADGKVGIGVSTPEDTLHVNGSIQAESTIKINQDTQALLSLYIDDVRKGILDTNGSSVRLQADAGVGFLNFRANDPAGYLWFDSGGSTERMRIDSAGNVKISTGNLELPNGGGWFQSDATWVRSLNNKGVYNASTAATAFATPGDFTAGYSDMRLKTHLGTIPDALDKVCSLEGFYYERNDTAQSLGYQGGERRVGLSAQDVQAVLPEVVKDAPINIDNGTDYLTIDYERVVPLLVESIKDLRAEIAALRSEMHDN